MKDDNEKNFTQFFSFNLVCVRAQSLEESHPTYYFVRARPQFLIVDFRVGGKCTHQAKGEGKSLTNSVLLFFTRKGRPFLSVLSSSLPNISEFILHGLEIPAASSWKILDDCSQIAHLALYVALWL